MALGHGDFPWSLVAPYTGVLNEGEVRTKTLTQPHRPRHIALLFAGYSLGRARSQITTCL